MSDVAEAIVLREPDVSSATTRVQRVQRMVEMTTVTCDDDYNLAIDECREIKAMHATIDGERRSFVDPLNGTVKRINDKYRPALTALEAAEAAIKAKCTTYITAVRRKAEQERAEAARAAQIEQERVRRESAEREEQARQKAEAERRAGNVAAAAVIEQAAAVETHAAEQAAIFIGATPVTVTAPPTASGASTAKSWDFALDDARGGLLAVVRHVAAHPEHIAVLALDEKVVRGLVKALGQNLGIPGITVTPKTTLRIGK